MSGKSGPIALALLVALATGCSSSGGGVESGSKGGGSALPNAGNDNAPPARPSPTPTLGDYESKLEYVRTARFAHIYVFSRRDAAEFTQEDITYIKANAPDRTNMWVITDDHKKIIAGTNFEFTPENLDAERKRFNVEDFPGR